MDVLIVDDEKSIRTTTALALESEGHYVEAVEDGASFLRRLKEASFDLVFLDLRLGDENGLELMAEALKDKPNQLIVMFTAHASIETAVKATRAGAFDYIQKPFTPDELRAVLVKAKKAQQVQTQLRQLESTVAELKTEASANMPPLRFESDDPATRQSLDVLFRAAGTPASILILGESGTGKSVIARKVHEQSSVKDLPFVTVSCPSLSRELLESELFGHVKGSFTGAVKDTWGKVHAAEGGTLFLDEVGELPLEIQPKLLRLLQEREYERLGENKIRTANVRVIAATNRDLRQCVAEGTFREDLYYRLNVIAVTLPPLRARRRDLLRFAEQYVDFFGKQFGRKIEGFTDDGREALLEHSWPGNLRELRNAIERAAILAHGQRLAAIDLPAPHQSLDAGTSQNGNSPLIGGEHSLEQIEEAHIRRVVEWAPSLHDAATILGIDKATLYRKRKRMGLE